MGITLPTYCERKKKRRPLHNFNVNLRARPCAFRPSSITLHVFVVFHTNSLFIGMKYHTFTTMIEVASVRRILWPLRKRKDTKKESVTEKIGKTESKKEKERETERETEGDRER